MGIILILSASDITQLSMSSIYLGNRKASMPSFSLLTAMPCEGVAKWKHAIQHQHIALLNIFCSLSWVNIACCELCSSVVRTTISTVYCGNEIWFSVYQIWDPSLFLHHIYGRSGHISRNCWPLPATALSEPEPPVRWGQLQKPDVDESVLTKFYCLEEAWMHNWNFAAGQ